MTFLQHKVSLDFVDILPKKSESAQLTLMEATFSSDLHMAQKCTEQHCRGICSGDNSLGDVARSSCVVEASNLDGASVLPQKLTLVLKFTINQGSFQPNLESAITLG